MLLEFAVGLNLVKKNGAADAFALEQLTNDGSVDEVVDGAHAVKLDQGTTVYLFVSLWILSATQRILEQELRHALVLVAIHRRLVAVL